MSSGGVPVDVWTMWTILRGRGGQKSRNNNIFSTYNATHNKIIDKPGINLFSFTDLKLSFGNPQGL